jgi:hypothetical protein
VIASATMTAAGGGIATDAAEAADAGAPATTDRDTGHDGGVTDAPDGTDPNPARAGVRDLPPVTERELAARRRGLASAYIPGGDDPDPERTHREESRYVRLLVIMVVAIVGSGLLVTFVGLALAGPAR